MRLRTLFIGLLAIHLHFPVASAATDATRGLKVVAKDNATQQLSEVSLYGKSYAVVIGIDEYPFLPHDRQLKYAVNDAKGMKKVLETNYKFDKIFTLYNKEATRGRILDLLTEEIPTQLGENDSLVVFFAGHGDQIKRPDGDVGYLVPHDGQIGKMSSVISMSEVRDTISKSIPAKHVFYVIDACYGGLLTATRAVDQSPRRDLAYLNEITKERVRQVLTAGGQGQEVLDGGPGGHSVFTGRLIEILQGTNDFITANEIQAAIREKVFGDARARNENQTPAYGKLYGSGDFVFIPKVASKAPPLKSGCVFPDDATKPAPDWVCKKSSHGYDWTTVVLENTELTDSKKIAYLRAFYQYAKYVKLETQKMIDGYLQLNDEANGAKKGETADQVGANGGVTKTTVHEYIYGLKVTGMEKQSLEITGAGKDEEVTKVNTVVVKVQGGNNCTWKAYVEVTDGSIYGSTTDALYEQLGPSTCSFSTVIQAIEEARIELVEKVRSPKGAVYYLYGRNLKAD